MLLRETLLGNEAKNKKKGLKNNVSLRSLCAISLLPDYQLFFPLREKPARRRHSQPLNNRLSRRWTVICFGASVEVSVVHPGHPLPSLFFLASSFTARVEMQRKKKKEINIKKNILQVYQSIWAASESYPAAPSSAKLKSASQQCGLSRRHSFYRRFVINDLVCCAGGFANVTELTKGRRQLDEF